MEDIIDKGRPGRVGDAVRRKAFAGNGTGKRIARENAEITAENIRGKGRHVEKLKSGVMVWKKTGRTS